MEDQAPITIDKVSKNFRLPHEKNTTIKGTIVNFWRSKRGYETLNALKDVSFNVNNGEFLGIVGRNGSGKSTLLKILAGIYIPTSGNVQIRGKIIPFIELGVGFSPELSGRDNVFLNGSLLGFSRKEMMLMYEDIVKFAELGKFMDQKLKNYSTGMQVRLAFSIAIKTQGDILILDEVLAVGDEAFQQKCIDVFESYKASGKTVILVTHDMEMVRKFCSRAILIDKGQIIEEGDPDRIASKYSKINAQDIKAEEVKDDKPTKISIGTFNLSGQPQKNFEAGSEMQVELSWPKSYKKAKNAGVAIIKNTGEYIYGTNTFSEVVKPKGNRISYTVNLDLGPGKYHLMAGVFGENNFEEIDFLINGPEFVVKSKLKDGDHGLSRLPHRWVNK